MHALKGQPIGTFIGLCVVLVLGFFGWAMVSGLVGWLVSAFGDEYRLTATYACFALYLWISVSTFSCWKQSLDRFQDESLRGKYLGTSWGFPLH